jgi:signal transduction histidine kinase
VPDAIHIQGDCTQILQVFLILLSNSFDAIEGLAEEWIQIEASLTDRGLQIAFTDSARNLPLHLHEQIFQPFLDQPDGGKDLGLGLSLARKYMEAHHGTLTIDAQSPNTRFVAQFLQLLDAKGHPMGCP